MSAISKTVYFESLKFFAAWSNFVKSPRTKVRVLVPGEIASNSKNWSVEPSSIKVYFELTGFATQIFVPR
jgi:hypothetical protein